MTNLHDEDVFKMTEELKDNKFKFKNKLDLNLSSLIDNKKVLFCDFQQGDVGNCGLLAALASMKDRREFLTEIAPSIHRTSNGVVLHFNMFCEGDPIKVQIDDALPFNEHDRLIFSQSARNDNSYLAALFEKAFVKQVCNKSYDSCEAVTPYTVYSSFSDSMISYIFWKKEDSKNNFFDVLKSELENKSSVTISVSPHYDSDPEDKNADGHCLCVMSYSEEHKAVKLYDPSVIAKYSVSSENLPSSFAATADSKKGEAWITLDRIENRKVCLTALHAKNMYKSYYQSKIR